MASKRGKSTDPPVNAWTSETAPRGGKVKGSLRKFSTSVKRSMAGIVARTVNSGSLESWILEIEDPVKRAELALRLADKFVPNASKDDSKSQKQDVSVSIEINDLHKAPDSEIIKVLQNKLLSENNG